jgi:hypothetical protein
MAINGLKSYGAPPMQPSIDDVAPAPAQSGGRSGVRALADRFMSSGTLFSPVGAVAATTGSAVANSMVREAISAVRFESAYMTNMVQSMGMRTGGIMSTGGTFGQAGTLATGAESAAKGMSALKSGLKAQVGIGAAIGAIMSLATNVHGAVTGKISKGEAAGNVATDTVSSGISAAGGALVGGLATVALGAVGIAGLPLTIVGIGAGVLGGVVTDGWFRKTKIAESIHNVVSQAFSK